MHGRRGVLELEEGAVKVNVTFVPRASIDDATGKYCISQQGSLYQLGVPAADEALEAAALVAAGALSEEGEQEKGGLEKEGLEEGGELEPRSAVLDSCHGLHVSVRQHSATAAAATATAAQMLSPKEDLQHLKEHLQDQCRRFGLPDDGDVDGLLDRIRQHVQRMPMVLQAVRPSLLQRSLFSAERLAHPSAALLRSWSTDEIGRVQGGGER